MFITSVNDIRARTRIKNTARKSRQRKWKKTCTSAFQKTVALQKSKKQATTVDTHLIWHFYRIFQAHQLSFFDGFLSASVRQTGYTLALSQARSHGV